MSEVEKYQLVKIKTEQLELRAKEEERVIQEVKGLDMVRRDWCPLSKAVGNYVLT